MEWRIIMNKSDFEFIRKDDKMQDYWFKVNGETKKELTNKYMEQSMIEVSHVVLSLVDNALGIQKEFLFNSYVSLDNNNNNQELKNFLLELIETIGKDNE